MQRSISAILGKASDAFKVLAVELHRLADEAATDETRLIDGEPPCGRTETPIRDFETEPMLCGRKDAARRLGMAHTTLDSLVHAGAIVPVILPRGGKKYSVEQIREWIKAQTTRAKLK